MQVTLFVKAGRTDPEVLGSCLASQTVHIAAKLKSLQFNPQLVRLDNPPPEFSAHFQRVPAVLLPDGSGTDHEVLQFLEQKFPGGLLKSDEKKLAKAEEITKDIYPRFCEYMLGADISRFLAALQSLDEFLMNKDERHLLGDEPSLLDCSVWPILHQVRVVLDRIKNSPLPLELSKVWYYLFHGYQNKKFTSATPSDVEICLEWSERIGISASDFCMPEWLPQEHHNSYHSFNHPQICVCPSKPPREEELPE